MINVPAWFTDPTRTATVVEDKGDTVVIEFEDGEQKEVPKSSLREFPKE